MNLSHKDAMKEIEAKEAAGELIKVRVPKLNRNQAGPLVSPFSGRRISPTH